MTDSTATVIHPDIRYGVAIARELVKLCVPGKIGPEHIYLVAGTSECAKDTLFCKRKSITGYLRRIAMPYTLTFLLGGLRSGAMVCYWLYDGGEDFMEAKLWYDQNAVLGRFPEGGNSGEKRDG